MLPFAICEVLPLALYGSNVLSVCRLFRSLARRLFRTQCVGVCWSLDPLVFGKQIVKSSPRQVLLKLCVNTHKNQFAGFSTTRKCVFYGFKWYGLAGKEGRRGVDSSRWLRFWIRGGWQNGWIDCAFFDLLAEGIGWVYCKSCKWSIMWECAIQDNCLSCSYWF